MEYTPQAWADNDVSKPVSAARMTVIENGIQAAAATADGAATTASSANTAATTANTAATKGAAADSIWRNYHRIKGSYYGANVSTVVFPMAASSSNAANNSPNYTTQALFWFDPSEWTVSGYTHKLRSRTTVFGAGSTGTNTITFGVYAVTGFSSAVSGYGFTTGASPVSGTTTTHTNVAALTADRQSIEFNGSLLSAGYYAVGYVTNAAGVTSTTTFINCDVDWRYV